LSFPVLVTAAGLATLALVCVAVFLPAYLVPSVIGVGALGLAPVVGRFVKKRLDATRQGAQAGAASYGIHGLPRVKSTAEAFNTDARPDVPGMVDYLLQQAVLHQASDVHLVPYRDFLLVRYRIDGILTDVAQLGAHLRETITNRLKVMSQAVSFVHDRPQDGRIDLRVGDRDVDLRVAFMPTLHGERIVMRVLDRGELGLGLASLGFNEKQLALFSDILFRPQGMVIMNGPAGSGKTTTIYAALRAILEHSQHGSSIYTLEDPIEYDLMNINQTQIEENQGFTFAHGLRTMLRQDPDVIMVGEIRDLDTARIAVQAGMTGHLIITTVHAKQASGVFVRLTEIGLDAHSVASAVTAVVAQRLVRLLCPDCKRPTPATPGQEAKLGLALAGQTFYAPAGCATCNQKGYTGRKGVYEILPVDETLRELIGDRASPDRIHHNAIERGMTTLIENGVRLAREGETSLEEVLRIVPVEQRSA
jgi:type II secretory ATPase GspE/PulE/Tfp pilus assembly ATPase PilB-like protein